MDKIVPPHGAGGDFFLPLKSSFKFQVSGCKQKDSQRIKQIKRMAERIFGIGGFIGGKGQESKDQFQVSGCKSQVIREGR